MGKSRLVQLTVRCRKISQVSINGPESIALLTSDIAVRPISEWQAKLPRALSPCRQKRLTAIFWTVDRLHESNEC